MENDQFDDPLWVADQLRLDWRERGFLRDDEASGEKADNEKVRKGKAIAHEGGALSRFATEAALKHLQSAGVIRCHQVRKIDENFTPVRGWMRLWPLVELLKADMVMTLADYADLSFIRMGEVLKTIPGRELDEKGNTLSLAESLARTWSGYVLYYFGHDVGDDAARREADEAMAEVGDTANNAHSIDPRLLLIDRRWLFVHERYLPEQFGQPETGPSGNPLADGNGWLLIADIRLFRSATWDRDWLFEYYEQHRRADGEVFYRFNDPRWDEAQAARKRPCTCLELNLVEPLRRFVHRNRKGTAS